MTIIPQRRRSAPDEVRQPRGRYLRILLLLTVIALGLWSRTLMFLSISPFAAQYAGDMLWALAIFLLLGILFPRKRTLHIALLALLIAFSIEASQLYHAPWIDAIRSTRLGGLILGYGFLWSDLVCYSCGVSVGAAGEMTARRFRKHRFRHTGRMRL
jgi:hypothetical protein